MYQVFIHLNEDITLSDLNGPYETFELAESASYDIRQAFEAIGLFPTKYTLEIGSA